jgi:MFS family permease
MKETKPGLFLALGGGILAGSFDLAIIGPSLPGMARQFQLEPSILSWAFTLYALFNLLSLPVLTGLADRFGKRRVLLFSLALFSISSLLASQAGHFGIVLVSRALSGIAVSGIFPLAPSLVRDHIPEGRRGRALGLIGASFGISLFAGPLLAGLLLDTYGWQSLFFLAALLGLGATALAMLFLPRSVTATPASIPWKSLLAVMISVGALAVLLSGTAGRIAGPQGMFPILFGILVVAGFFALRRLELNNAHPLLPKGILSDPLSRTVLILGIGTGVIQAAYIFLPHYLVGMPGITGSRASFLLLPIVVLFTLGNWIAGHLSDRYGPRKMLLGGWLLMGLALALIGWGQSLNLYLLSTLFFGLGLSTLESPSLRYILVHLDFSSYTARAQGLLSVFISLGQLSGSALLGMLASTGNGEDYGAAYRWMLVVVALAIVLGLRLRK